MNSRKAVYLFNAKNTEVSGTGRSTWNILNLNVSIYCIYLYTLKIYTHTYAYAYIHSSVHISIYENQGSFLITSYKTANNTSPRAACNPAAVSLTQIATSETGILGR